MKISDSLYFSISGFCIEAVENCALLGCYEASRGHLLPTCRDNLSVPSLGFQNPFLNPWKLEPTGCPATSVKNYHYLLRNNTEARRSQYLLLSCPIRIQMEVYRSVKLHLSLLAELCIAGITEPVNLCYSSLQQETFLFPKQSRTSLMTTQSPIQQVSVTYF
jgi:hypothetical protein